MLTVTDKAWLVGTDGVEVAKDCDTRRQSWASMRASYASKQGIACPIWQSYLPLDISKLEVASIRHSL